MSLVQGKEKQRKIPYIAEGEMSAPHQPRSVRVKAFLPRQQSFPGYEHMTVLRQPRRGRSHLMTNVPKVTHMMEEPSKGEELAYNYLPRRSQARRGLTRQKSLPCHDRMTVLRQPRSRSHQQEMYMSNTGYQNPVSMHYYEQTDPFIHQNDFEDDVTYDEADISCQSVGQYEEVHNNQLPEHGSRNMMVQRPRQQYEMPSLPQHGYIHRPYLNQEGYLPQSRGVYYQPFIEDDIVYVPQRINVHSNQNQKKRMFRTDGGSTRNSFKKRESFEEFKNIEKIEDDADFVNVEEDDESEIEISSMDNCMNFEEIGYANDISYRIKEEIIYDEDDLKHSVVERCEDDESDESMNDPNQLQKCSRNDLEEKEKVLENTIDCEPALDANTSEEIDPKDEEKNLKQRFHSKDNNAKDVKQKLVSSKSFDAKNDDDIVDPQNKGTLDETVHSDTCSKVNLDEDHASRKEIQASAKTSAFHFIKFFGNKDISHELNAENGSEIADNLSNIDATTEAATVKKSNEATSKVEEATFSNDSTDSNGDVNLCIGKDDKLDSVSTDEEKMQNEEMKIILVDNASEIVDDIRDINVAAETAIIRESNEDTPKVDKAKTFNDPIDYGKNSDSGCKVAISNGDLSLCIGKDDKLDLESTDEEKTQDEEMKITLKDNASEIVDDIRDINVAAEIATIRESNKATSKVEKTTTANDSTDYEMNSNDLSSGYKIAKSNEVLSFCVGIDNKLNLESTDKINSEEKTENEEEQKTVADNPLFLIAQKQEGISNENDNFSGTHKHGKGKSTISDYVLESHIERTVNHITDDQGKETKITVKIDHTHEMKNAGKYDILEDRFEMDSYSRNSNDPHDPSGEESDMTFFSLKKENEVFENKTLTMENELDNKCFKEKDAISITNNLKEDDALSIQSEIKEDSKSDNPESIIESIMDETNMYDLSLEIKDDVNETSTTETVDNKCSNNIKKSFIKEESIETDKAESENLTTDDEIFPSDGENEKNEVQMETAEKYVENKKLEMLRLYQEIKQINEKRKISLETHGKLYNKQWKQRELELQTMILKQQNNKKSQSFFGFFGKRS